MLASAEPTVVIRLDRRVPLEALVMNRLQRVPELRRDEWLRNLLILGFRAECQSIKDQQPNANHNNVVSRPTLQYSYGLRHSAINSLSAKVESEAVINPIEHNYEVRNDKLGKPFAQLKKVIGT